MGVTLREYLVANMFDGDDDGVLTQRISSLLDEICENVAIWFIEQSGAAVAVERYYAGDREWAERQPQLEM